MKINKKILIFFILILSILSILYGSFKLSVKLFFPSNIVSVNINEIFKKSFGKAIKFDSLSFDFKGDIILHNFYLSNSIDFNDNINLIKCNKMIIDTSLFSLLHGNIKICGFSFINSLVTIEKSYGKSYKYTFMESFHLGEDRKRSKFIEKDKLKIFFKNSQFSYKEVFKKSKTSINLYDLDINIKYQKNIISYRLEGFVKNKNLQIKYNGKLLLEGKLNIANYDIENKAEFENIDISYLNDFINEKKMIDLTLKGALSGVSYLSRNKENFNFKGDFQASKLNVYYFDKNNSHQIILNENLHSSIEYSINKNGKITVNTFNFDDEIFKLTSKGSYSEDEQLNILFKTNSIDLAQFAENINPFFNYNYKGLVHTKGDLSFDLKNKIPLKIDFIMYVKDFNRIPKLKNSGLLSITDCNSSIELNNSKIFIKSNFKQDKSDFNIDFSGIIKNWNPFTSTSSMNIISNNIELSLITKTVKKVLSGIYQKGFVDMYKGYNQSFFLKEPEGVFLNNNDFNLNYNSAKLSIAGEATLKNLALKINLQKGYLKTDLFNLEGYDGKYLLNIFANLRQNYPFIQLEGNFSNLNLDAISNDSDQDFSYSGLLNANFSYNANIYRVGHFIENGKGELNLSIKNGTVVKSKPQMLLTEFLNKNNYDDINLNNIEFSNFTLGFKQVGSHFYVKNFGLYGPILNFKTYGEYDYQTGLRVPIKMSYIKDKRKKITVPLLLCEELYAPCVKINSKKINKSVCF